MALNRWNKKTKGFPLQGAYSYILAAVIGLAAADLIITAARSYMLPQPAPVAGPGGIQRNRFVPPADYNGIIGRNIFSKTIPPPLRDDGEGAESEDNIPVPSQLPLNLVGTIVLSQGDRSIATIELRGKNKVLPFSVGDDIDEMAQLTSVERKRAIFRNRNNGRLEFIEIKDAGTLSFNRGGKTPAAPAENKEVVEEGRNRYSVDRANLLKYTNNLADVLQQARAVPNRDPVTGAVNGFKILDMNKDSIFGQLGLNVGDVIKGVNGEPVTSPAQAMRLYQALKDSKEISLMLESEGRDVEKVYTIR